METRSLLLRRLTLWAIFAVIALEGFVFSFCSAIFKHVTDEIFGGKPLPVLSQWLLDVGCWYAVLPGVTFLIALAFTVWKQPSETLTLSLVIATVLLAGLLLFFFGIGICLPFMSGGCVGMQ